MGRAFITLIKTSLELTHITFTCVLLILWLFKSVCAIVCFINV